MIGFSPDARRSASSGWVKNRDNGSSKNEVPADSFPRIRVLPRNAASPDYRSLTGAEIPSSQCAVLADWPAEPRPTKLGRTKKRLASLQFAGDLLAMLLPQALTQMS